MLFRREFLDGIRRGDVTLAFRLWRRPSVRAGGTLLTPAGRLSIGSVKPVALNRISQADARHAGYESRQGLIAELQRRAEGLYYRIELGPLRPDPRIALRKSPARTIAQTRELHERLRRMDALAHDGSWTRRTLQVIKTHPGVRAGDLCGLLGQEKKPFKINVRKLKRLGLTESLKTGYRLSIRGNSLLATFQSKHSSTSRSKQ